MAYGYLYSMTEEEYYLLQKLAEEIPEEELREAFPDWEPTEEELSECLETYYGEEVPF